MGRQIRFHIVQEDANELINLIYSKGGIIINKNENGAEASEDELLHIMDKNILSERIELLLGVSNFRIQI